MFLDCRVVVLFRGASVLIRIKKSFDAFSVCADVRIGVEPYIDPFTAVTRHEQVVVTYGFVLRVTAFVLTLIDLDRDHRVPCQVPEINASSVGAIAPEVHGGVVYERVAVPSDERVAHGQFARFGAYVCRAWICREHVPETVRAIAIVAGRWGYTAAML